MKAKLKMLADKIKVEKDPAKKKKLQADYKKEEMIQKKIRWKEFEKMSKSPRVDVKKLHKLAKDETDRDQSKKMLIIVKKMEKDLKARR